MQEAILLVYRKATMNILKSWGCSGIMPPSLKKPMKPNRSSDQPKATEYASGDPIEDANRDDRTSGESGKHGFSTERPTSRRQDAADASGCRVSENGAPNSKTHDYKRHA
jgi:hypothetical protein